MFLSYNDFLSICTSKNLLMQYQQFDGSDKVYNLFAYDGQTKFECSINDADHLTEVTDFETNYKSNANKPIDQRESETGLVKTKPRPVEGTLQTYIVYFTTSDINSLDAGNHQNYWSISYDSNNGITKIKVSPTYSYYIDGGYLKILQTPPTIKPKASMYLAPNTPYQWEFVGNKKFNYEYDFFLLEVPPKYVKYYEAVPSLNVAELQITHNPGDQINFEYYIKIYV